jgi:murein DD-endopeptidase MepM/ murein hydrolase activator NlpD
MMLVDSARAGTAGGNHSLGAPTSPRRRRSELALSVALGALALLVVPVAASADPPSETFGGGAAADERGRSGAADREDGRREREDEDRRDADSAPDRDEEGAPSSVAPRRLTFPIRGRHTFGATGGTFGSARGGRSHQGQDVMAACGTPLVAAASGVISHNAFQGLAGNYVVIDARGADYVYMHLSARSPLAVGTTVRAGQPIATVGATGNARGCHLHFEIWTEPGYRRGGQPIDPLPILRGGG